MATHVPSITKPEGGLRLFLNYRRDESAGEAGRLYDGLVARFGQDDRVFMDIDDIPIGVDFLEVVHSAVESADVVLAVIGRRWLDVTDKDGRRRIDNPEDPVRIELEVALQSEEALVVPVLVQGAEMPSAHELPDGLRALARRNAHQMSHAHWSRDLARLIEALDAFGESGPQEAHAREAPLGGQEPSRHDPRPPAAASDSDGEKADLPPAPPGYRIEAILREAEMGTLYSATQVALKRSVALRILTGEQAADPAFRQRFLREAEVVAELAHPNVLPVYDAGEDGTRVFVASRLVDGKSLWRLRHDEQRLAPARAANLLAQVADGLDAAHRRGIVHGDMNLINVLVGTDNGQEHAYVTGFGLRDRQDESSGLTRAGHFFATPAYTAPELIRGESVDGRADVYSLGCILFHVLTGSLPFEGDSLMAQLFAHVSDDVPNLRDVAPDVPATYDEIVHTAAAKDPADRHATAADLAQALRSIS